MTLLLDLAIRSSVLVLVGLALCAMLRKQPAALRHAVLAMTLFASAALIPLTLIVPAWEVTVPAWDVALPATSGPALLPTSSQSAAEPAARVAATGAVPARPRLSITHLAWIVWIGGFVLCAAALLTAFVRLIRIARRARRVDSGDWADIVAELRAAYGVRRPVAILQTDTTDLLATCGTLRPRVLLPTQAAQWSRDRIRVVLSHELAHVRRHDWLVQMTAEALRCVYWFNPLLWIACARLRCESEYACDDVVLGRGMAPRDYAAQLLELARVCRRPRAGASLAAMPMARASTLERRVSAMLNSKLNRRAVSRRGWAAAAILFACLSVSIAAVRSGEKPQTSPALFGGTVYDPTGGVMPGVTVTLRDAQEHALTAMTNASGRFEIPSIAPGAYALEAKLPGFRTLKQTLVLEMERDWDRAITLQVGEVSESVTVSASRVGGATTAMPPPRVVRVGGNIRAPRKLRDVKPVYPESMQEAGREGVVPMEAVIATDGSVAGVRVLSADIHPDFAMAAVDAVRQWRFAPTLLNGTAIEIRMAVTVSFKLSN
jgi:TonB family protein